MPAVPRLGRGRLGALRWIGSGHDVLDVGGQGAGRVGRGATVKRMPTASMIGRTPSRHSRSKGVVADGVDEAGIDVIAAEPDADAPPPAADHTDPLVRSLSPAHRPAVGHGPTTVRAARGRGCRGAPGSAAALPGVQRVRGRGGDGGPARLSPTRNDRPGGGAGDEPGRVPRPPPRHRCRGRPRRL